MKWSSKGSLISALLYAGGIFYLLLAADRQETLLLYFSLLLCIPGYFLALKVGDQEQQTAWFRLGLALRVVALMAFPLLSEDIFRFLWDGELWWAGHHPLEAVPLEWELRDPAFAKTHNSLLVGMNSPGYFTVYPPLAQALFILSTIGPLSVFQASILFKLPLLAADWGVYKLLGRLNPTRLAFVQMAWWLHPLVLIEGTGNAHFESLALLFLLAGIHYAKLATESSFGSGRLQFMLRSGGLVGLGVLSKLLPLLAAPLLMFQLGKGLDLKQRGIAWLSFAGSLTLVLLVGFGWMFWKVDLLGFGESLDLYFRKFEFNGSLYQIARSWGIWYRGWNWIEKIGPAMAALAGLSIMLLSLIRVNRPGFATETWLWIFAIYLACSTTVHPWYFIYLIGLGLLGKYRWPLVLGFSSFLSYLAYSQDPIEVPLCALLPEYLLPLIYGIWEWTRIRTFHSQKGTVAP